MLWINNTEKEKPELDEKYKGTEYKFSVEVIVHTKIGFTFVSFWDFKEECWWDESTRISDSEVMFWCRIPKLPKIIGKK